MKNMALCIFLAFILVSFFIPLKVIAETIDDELVISGQHTWTLAKSPYILRADVRVLDDGTLTVDPGVKIVVEKGTIFVQGNLIVGSSTKQTTIESDVVSPVITVDGGKAQLTYVHAQINMLANVYRSGTLLVDNLTAQNGAGPTSYISVYQGSNVKITNSQFSNILTPRVIEVFNGSSLELNRSAFSTSSSQAVLSIFDVDGRHSSAVVSNSKIMGAPYDGVEVSEGAHLQMEKTLISNSKAAGLTVFSQGSAEVSSSTFFSNKFGATSYSSDLHITHSNFEENNVALESYGKIAIAQYNWWGTSTGPNIVQQAYTSVNTSPWSLKKIRWDAEPCCSSVLFIPGLEASRLYKKDRYLENQLWEPNGNADVKKLYLFENGTSKDSTIYTKDIISSTKFFGIPVQTVYKDFTNSLDYLATNKDIKEWQSLPYDWRLMPNMFVQQGIKRSNGKYLMPLQLIEEIAERSRTKQVTIVAHSNGGLVAKEIARQLEAAGKSDLLDDIVFVAVPEYGTPQTVAALLHGDGQSIMKGLLLSKDVARTFSTNMSSAYALLPTEEYFKDNADSEVLKFTVTSPNVNLPYGTSITSQSSLFNFLTSTAHERGTVMANSSNTNWPMILNSALLTQATLFHQFADKWQPSADGRVFTIVATGKDTLKGIEYVISYCKGLSWLATLLSKSKCGYSYPKRLPLISNDGDGIVMRGGIGKRAEGTYVVNLFGINKDTRKNYSHMNVMSVPQVLHIIEDIILKREVQPQAHVYTFGQSDSQEYVSQKKYIYKASSEVTLSAVDSGGKRTGAKPRKPVDGSLTVEEEIPNSSYVAIGDGQQLITNELPQHVEIQGVNLGVFDLVIETKGGGSAYYSSFSNVPVTSTTQGSLITSTTSSSSMELVLDDDSDGEPDRVVTPDATSTPNLINLLPAYRQRIASSSPDAGSLVTKRYLDRFDAFAPSVLQHNIKEAIRLNRLTLSRIVLVVSDLERAKFTNKKFDVLALNQYSILYTVFSDLEEALERLQID